MKKYFRTLLILAAMMGIIALPSAIVQAGSGDDVDYNRDYLMDIYNSDNGLDGSSANCIYSSDDGFIWIGCYTGLYRYDGAEFKRILMEERAIPVNDIVEDADHILWIGTNGDGLYNYDGQNFSRVDLLVDENGVDTIEKLFYDTDGVLWAGTKAGLFSIESGETKYYESLAGLDVRDISELTTKEKVIIEKKGKVFLTDSSDVNEIKLEDYEGKNIPRCVSEGKEDYFYIGTDGDEILKMDNDGNFLEVISGCASSFNDIWEFEDGKYWACSDNGISILEDGTLRDAELKLNDSVEETCRDYQGNYWFASSRTGIMELYANEYADLGAYWGLDEVVNTLEVEGDTIYVGSDKGLYCCKNGWQVKNNLTNKCADKRIRQIYKDRDGRLWVSTYDSGIFVQNTDGKIYEINKTNSALTTDQIRCVFQRNDGNILIGTEEGIFICKYNTKISRLTEDEVLNSSRILDVRESEDGTVYAATDGLGAYAVDEDGTVRNYSREEGLFSGNVMKVVPSVDMNGVWLVMGEGICFLDDAGKVTDVTGIKYANTLDMILTDDGNALIIASNGLFETKESDLLNSEKISYTHSGKQDGLPIDFTANAWNTLSGNILYMCGTSGAASVDISKESIDREIKIYLEDIRADGEEITLSSDGIEVPADTHRLSLSIKPINYVYRNISAAYMLSGIDTKEMISDSDADIDISYTDLEGGEYTYNYRIMDTDTNETLAKVQLHITKDYTFWEEPDIRRMLSVFIVVAAVLILIGGFCLIELRVRKHYQKQLRKAREEEITRLAYYDLATGVFNRNYYEEIVQSTDSKRVFAAFSVGVNFVEYYRRERGILFVEEMLRTGISVLKEVIEENDIKIFRISDNVFCFWLTEPIKLEEFIFRIKALFEEKGNKDTPFSFSVGGSYNNREENIRDLLVRCEKMRILDEKLSEANFIDAKIKSFE